MKYLNFILTVIAVFLVSISLHLWFLKISIERLDETNRLVLSAQESFIQSSNRLEQGMITLGKQIQDIKEKMFR